jgi:hydrogenase nickel incorporation protein HypB
MPQKIVLARKVETKNQEAADALRIFFQAQGLFVVDIIGSPGAGKTSLLEAMAASVRGRAAVIEGDLETARDLERIEGAGLPVCQINTLGACHLDAHMIKDALDTLSLDGLDLLFIENVGNLVCPASFSLGENMKMAVISVTEGDDKPAKYPSAIRKSEALILSKMDLLPHVDCDVDAMERDALEINPELQCFRVCAKTGEGVEALLSWLQDKVEHARHGD